MESYDCFRLEEWDVQDWPTNNGITFLLHMALYKFFYIVLYCNNAIGMVYQIGHRKCGIA